MRFQILSLLCLTVSLTSCASIPNPEIRVSAVRLLEEETKIANAAGDAFLVAGYLLFTVESDIDLLEVTKEKKVGYGFTANTCDTRVEMDKDYYPYPLGNRSYQLLIHYKSHRNPRMPYASSQKRPSYNLAAYPEDVCITIWFRTMFPPLRIKSNEVRYPLSDPLRENLRAYEQKGGVIRLKPFPNCRRFDCGPSSF